MHLTLSKKSTTAGSEVMSHEDVPRIAFFFTEVTSSLKSR